MSSTIEYVIVGIRAQDCILGFGLWALGEDVDGSEDE